MNAAPEISTQTRGAEFLLFTGNPSKTAIFNIYLDLNLLLAKWQKKKARP